MLHLLKVGLRHGATSGVLAPTDGEKGMNTAIGSAGDVSTGIHHEGETGFANGAIRGNEKRHGVVPAICCTRFELRIRTDVGILGSGGAGTANAWLRMA